MIKPKIKKMFNVTLMAKEKHTCFMKENGVAYI